MMIRALLSFLVAAALALGVASHPAAAANVAGVPSYLRLQSLGVGTAAPSAAGSVIASGVVQAGTGIGVGAAPGPWSCYLPVQSGESSALAFGGCDSAPHGVVLASNVYFDGTYWRYINTGAAFIFEVGPGTSGAFIYEAASGSAGATVAFTAYQVVTGAVESAVIGGTTCSVSDGNGISSCTTNSTGNWTVTFSSASSTRVCTATPYATQGFVITQAGDTTHAVVEFWSVSNVAANNTISLHCYHNP